MEKVVVLGLGMSGLSACRFLLKKGYFILACDDKLEAAKQKKEAAFLLEESHVALVSKDECLTQLETIAFLVTSPGIFPTHPVLEQAKKLNVSIIGDVELALRELSSLPPPMIGITGTNGKTTVTLLTQAMLQCQGYQTRAAGNIGLALLDEVEAVQREKSSNPLVVELSSFQLETMSTKLFQVGVVLNVTPDHLDYHGNMQEYLRAKMRLAGCIKEKEQGGILFVHEKVPVEKSPQIKRYGFSISSDVHTDGVSVIRYKEKEIELPEILQSLFSHDVENFLAAYALARELGVSPQSCVDAFCMFTKPPHRIQFVKEVAGVKYYDDSKGTNLDAVIRAVDSIPTKIVLIAGGVHKGEAYTSWLSAFHDKVQQVFAIGEAAPLIEKDLAPKIPVKLCKTLDEAVAEASKIAREGQTVLLSPGCSSFDMFKSYKERGEKFCQLVESL